MKSKKENMTTYFKPNPTPVTGQPSASGELSGNKIAICCGINNYPGTQNDLNGCVNDAIEWHTLLTSKYGFKARLLKDGQVTWDNVVNGLKELVSKSGEGVHCVFTYSGHGSNVPSTDSDEADSRDECICLYDKWLIDDDIRMILSAINPNGRFTFISDSCHSATVTREFLSTLNEGSPYAKPRYLAAPSNVKGLVKRVRKTKEMFAEEGMKEVLISGCLATEYSYDANMNGKYMGAMSYYATNILKSTPKLTYNDFYSKLSKQLPSSRYPQSPCLEGKEVNKKQLMFT